MNRIAGLFALLLLIAPNAQALDIGVGVKAGTIGAGFELSVPISKTINARVSLTSIDIDDERETLQVGDDIDNAELDAVLGLDFGATALLIDWYVFDGSFHLTAGMVKNDTKLAFSGVLTGDITVDGEPLSPDDIDGNVTGNVSLGESFQPYLGIGWGRRAGDEGGLAFTAELGVALLDPAVSLNAQQSGSSTLNPTEFDDAIRGVESDAEAELDQFEAWPVLTLGLNYNF
jgi:hypothetical protein